MTVTDFVIILVAGAFIAMLVWDWGYRVAQRDRLSMDELDNLIRVEECRDKMYRSLGLTYFKSASYWRKMLKQRKDRVTKPVQG